MKIDKGVPIPDDGRGRHSKYPWKEMEVGDSFLTTDRNVYSAATQQSKRNGGKFTVRKENDGFRVWRVAVVLLPVALAILYFMR